VLPNGNYYLPDLARLFPPTWQHHRLMIASTIVVTTEHHLVAESF
jgi:hypothetical protein